MFTEYNSMGIIKFSKELNEYMKFTYEWINYNSFNKFAITYLLLNLTRHIIQINKIFRKSKNIIFFYKLKLKVNFYISFLKTLFYIFSDNNKKIILNNKKEIYKYKYFDKDKLNNTFLKLNKTLEHVSFKLKKSV